MATRSLCTLDFHEVGPCGLAVDRSMFLCRIRHFPCAIVNNAPKAQDANFMSFCFLLLLTATVSEKALNETGKVH
jgi:hypothetical protein